MIQKLLPIAVAIALGFSGTANSMTKSEHKMEGERLSLELKAARNRCGDTFKGNAKDICMAEANGANKVAKAELEVRYNDTSKTRMNARLAKADSAYSIARERCDDQGGNARDVCLKEAKAAFTRDKVDAQTDRKISDVRGKANQEVADMRRDAAENKRDADYNAAKERCDTLKGNARDSCITDAKARFGVK